MNQMEHHYNNLRLIKAVKYNYLIIFILPILLYLIIEDLFKIIFIKLESKEYRKLSLIE